MEILFFTVFLLLLLLNKSKSKSLFNGFAIVFTPYTFIIVVNNFFCPDFYSIRQEVIAILLLGMIVYEAVFLVFYFANKNKPLGSTERLIDCASIIKFRLIEWLVALITFFRLISVGLVLLRGGLSLLSADNYSSLDLGIIGGRFIIFLYPLGWILGLKAFNPNIRLKKRVFDLFLSFVIVLVLFLSTVKAHAAIFAIGLFVVACIVNKKNIIKGGVVLVLLVFLLFFGNYAIRWFAADSSIPTLEYTIRHFWKYVAGGTINMNGTALSGTTQYNFFDYWVQVISPIPNEFLGVVGLKIQRPGYLPYIASMASVSPKFEELSNVINLFGFFYGEGGLNIIGYIINVAFFAFITEYASFNVRNPKTIARFVFSVCILTYAFLSFFSLYYATSGFWQIMIYSLIIPWIFGGGIKGLSLSRRSINKSLC